MALFGGKKKRSRRDRDDDRYPDYSGDPAEQDYADAEYGDADDYDYDFDESPTDERVYGTFDEPPAPVSAPAGPYDITEAEGVIDLGQRLDLGSVLIPVPDGGQLQVEMSPDGTPQAVHLATENGRLTVAAYAAPKSGGQWRTVAADLADSLRGDGAKVAVETGPWGREVRAVTETADLRFVGVDGPRWMLRLVAAGHPGSVEEGSPLVVAARAVLAQTVVRRGTDPLPVRDPLPVVLPKELAEQLAAAHAQQVAAAQQAAAAQAAAQTAPPQPVLPPKLPDEPRRGAGGSAMQQLGL
ncbi:DUF3710 domain-containing protein [Nocardia thailandica]|uniref:DUF3710 domain-containing protein n=1 Tax=Nocardia thailandica TaxID=257275 RepID=A0ABW6PQE0_9NOCA